MTLFLRASPVRAPDNAGAIHIDRTQIQMTISSVPSGLIAFNCDATQAKAWAKFPRPFGPKPAPKSDRLPGLAWVTSYNALGLKDREKPQTLRLPAWEREPSTGIFRIALSCSKRFGSGSATPPIQSSPPRKKMSFRSFDRFFMHSINLSRWCSACSSRHRGSLPWLQPFAGGEELVFPIFVQWQYPVIEAVNCQKRYDKSFSYLRLESDSSVSKVLKNVTISSRKRNRGPIHALVNDYRPPYIPPTADG